MGWHDLQAGGYTDLGAALDLLGTALTVPPMQERALAPAIVLVSDGMPTDDFEQALARLMELRGAHARYGWQWRSAMTRRTKRYRRSSVTPIFSR